MNTEVIFLIGLMTPCAIGGLVYAGQLLRNKSGNANVADAPISSGADAIPATAISPPPRMVGWRIGNDAQALVELLPVERHGLFNSRISSLPDAPRKGAGGFSISTEVKHQIEGLLQAVPGAAKEAMSLSGGWYRLRFDPEVWRQIQLGNAEIVKSGDHIRALARDAGSGKFIGVGDLVPVAAASKVLSGLWQIASVVTFQQYLHTIHSQLAQIQSSVDGIRSWLRSEQAGALIARHNYLAQIVTSVTTNRVAAPEFNAFVAQIEETEIVTLSTFEATRLRLREHLEKLKLLRFKNSHLTENEYTFLIGECANDMSTAAAAVYIRVTGARVGIFLGLEHHRLMARLESALVDVKALQQLQNEVFSLVPSVAPKRHFGAKILNAKYSPARLFGAEENSQFESRMATMLVEAQASIARPVATAKDTATMARSEFMQQESLIAGTQEIYVKLDRTQKIQEIRH